MARGGVPGRLTSVASDPWPATALAAWWAVAVFTLAAILSYTDRQILSLLVDPIGADLRISDTQISLLQGLAFAAIYSVVGLPMGRLADVLPRRRVIICGVLLWTAATIACGLSRSFGQLFLARVFVGVGEAALSPAVMSMVADMFPPERRGTVIGVLWMGMVIGGGVALGVGGEVLHAAQSGAFQNVPLLASLAPWRASLLALTVPGLAVILLLLTVREPRRRSETFEPLATRFSLRQVGEQLFARRNLVLPLLGAGACTSVVDFSLLNWIPTLLERNYHLGAQDIGRVLGAIVIVTGACGAVLGGSFSDRLARAGGPRLRLMGAAGAATLGLPLMVIGATSQPWEVLVMFGWWNFFSSAIGATQVTVLQESVPNQMRGVTVSLIAFCNIAIGLGLGTLATGLLIDRVFHDRLSIATSLGAVVTPASVLGCVLLWFAASKAKRKYSVPGRSAIV
jgi:MFS family permease